MRIRPQQATAAASTSAAAAAPEKECLYAIERIQEARENSDGQLEYLIKWKDRSESENSWESVNDLYSKKKSPPTVNPADRLNGTHPIDISDEASGNWSIRSMFGGTSTPSATVATANVQSNENEPTVVPMQEETNEPPSKKRRIRKVREISPNLDRSKENEEQQQVTKRRNPKRNANAQIEHDSMMKTPPKQQLPLVEQQQQQQQKQPRKRNRRESIPAKIDQIENNLSIPGTAGASTATATATATATVTAPERTIERVENMRKRKNHHEYLVKWTLDDTADWIDRDVMIKKYPQHLIAYFERITEFKQSTTMNTTTTAAAAEAATTSTAH